MMPSIFCKKQAAVVRLFGRTASMLLHQVQPVAGDGLLMFESVIAITLLRSQVAVADPS